MVNENQHKTMLISAGDAYYTCTMDEKKRKPGQQPIEPGEKSVVVPIRMTAAQKIKLAALGGAAWVRKRIDRAKE